MKVIQLSASLSRSAGGIFEIELALSQHLHRLGVNVMALGLEDSYWKADSERWAPVDAKVCKVNGPMAFGYSSDLRRYLDEEDADLGHLHSLWMYPSVAIRQWNARSGNPYVVTPNGMLEPWALRNSAWKKRTAGMLYENRCLHGAACLQANTEKELADFRAYGLKNPIAIIPNGIDLPEIGGRISGERGQETGKKILLFLGRLHPKKGLVNAIRAWAKIRGQESGVRGREEWQFVIAGWDQGGHEEDLKRLCTELGLGYTETSAASFPADNCKLNTENSQIAFVGSVFGQEKDALLRSSSAFILPSFSEGLPMSVLEAWSYRLPVLMTDHCNLPEGFAVDAALRIGTDTESIAEGMRQLFSLPTTDHRQQTTSLSSLGDNGLSLVERQFTWPQVAAQMKEVYGWVLGGGERPDCVRQF